MLDLSRYTQPADCGKALRDALQAGGLIDLPPGFRADLGSAPVNVPSGAWLRGDPRAPAWLGCAAVYDQGRDAAGVQHISSTFELGDGVTLEDLTLESTCGALPQAVLVGYVNNPGSAVLRRCKLLGTAWALYSWQTADSVNIRAEDCTIVAANIPVAAAASRLNAHHYDLLRCKIVIDPTRSNYHGAVDVPSSGGVIGIACRGGYMRGVDCSISLAARTGPDGKPERCVGVTDWCAGGDKSATVELFNLTVTGPADYGLDFHQGQCRYYGGSVGKVNGNVTKLGS